MVLIGVLVGTLWGAGQALGGSEPVPGRVGDSRYQVQAGDTLWTIARREVGPEGDPRPLIADIHDLNGLPTSALRTGQVLVLP